MDDDGDGAEEGEEEGAAAAVVVVIAAWIDFISETLPLHSCRRHRKVRFLPRLLVAPVVRRQPGHPGLHI